MCRSTCACVRVYVCAGDGDLVRSMKGTRLEGSKRMFVVVRITGKCSALGRHASTHHGGGGGGGGEETDSVLAANPRNYLARPPACPHSDALSTSLFPQSNSRSQRTHQWYVISKLHI